MNDVHVIDSSDATILEVDARRDPWQFLCGACATVISTGFVVATGFRPLLLVATLLLLWYVVVGLGWNRNQIRIDAGGITSRIRPLPPAGRRIATLAEACEAHARSYTVHGRDYHAIFVGGGGPLAFAGSESAAHSAAQLIRAYAHRWQEPRPRPTYRF